MGVSRSYARRRLVCGCEAGNRLWLCSLVIHWLFFYRSGLVSANLTSPAMASCAAPSPLLHSPPEARVLSPEARYRRTDSVLSAVCLVDTMLCLPLLRYLLALFFSCRRCCLHCVKSLHGNSRWSVRLYECGCLHAHGSLHGSCCNISHHTRHLLTGCFFTHAHEQSLQPCSSKVAPATMVRTCQTWSIWMGGCYRRCVVNQ